MKKLLIIASALFLVGCLGMPRTMKPVSNFNIDKYLGKWYEVARLYPKEIKMRVTDFEHSPERLSTKAYGAPLDSHLPASSRTLGISIATKTLTPQLVTQ